MRYVALIAVVAAVLLLTGCENKTSKPEARMEEPNIPLDEVNSTPADDPYAGAASPAGPVTSPKPKARGSDEVLTPGGGKTYVVQKGDTLYGLARKFYHDPSKWKTIWEANKARIPNKDKLVVGTKLIIP